MRSLLIIGILAVSNMAMAADAPPKHKPALSVPASKGVLVTKQDYSKIILLEPKDFDQPGHQMQVVIVPPKTRMRTHWHNKQTEAYYILEGGSWVILDGKKFMTAPGDSFIVRPGVKHTVWNDSDKPFKQVVFKIDYPEGDDTVWEEGK